MTESVGDLRVFAFGSACMKGLLGWSQSTTPSLHRLAPGSETITCAGPPLTPSPTSTFPPPTRSNAGIETAERHWPRSGLSLRQRTPASAAVAQRPLASSPLGLVRVWVDNRRQGGGGEPELHLIDPVEGRDRRIRREHQERDRGRGPERHARRKCRSSRQPSCNSVAGGGHQLRRHPSVDDREPFDLESAVWTSIASIVAPTLLTATHSGDPNDPGVASRTVNRAARRRVVRPALAHARSPDPSRLESMPALIFDLDGTLVDTVYAHVFAWQRALAEVGLPIDGWRIHRRIGMSGGLFTRAVARELARPLTSTEVEAIQARHGATLSRAASGATAAPRGGRTPGRAADGGSAVRDRDLGAAAGDRRLARGARPRFGNGRGRAR